MNLRNIIVLFILINFTSKAYSEVRGISYMSKEGLERVIPYAKRDNKPILIYLHSQHCYTSKKFTREIMSSDSVRKFVGPKYFCINGDIAYEFGTTYAKKHEILILPTIILLAPDGNHQFQVDMTYELDILFGQISRYVSTCSILMQSSLLKSTSKLSEGEALSKIGASYAKTDFMKRREIHPRDNCRRFLVDMSKLNHFKNGYYKEWENLLEEEKKKVSATSN
ncbi:MAG: thioredoxin family protein [Bacteroidota bacterium]|nr:thioredoxin family protein [Bacteroidota bacterium]